ncbi:MAG: alpha/beta hydrolase [Proteobacteria bacterium]|nr:alpha/beta hydrolase [Pseudomonadota bacterium]
MKKKVNSHLFTILLFSMLIFSILTIGCSSSNPDVTLEEDPGLPKHSIYRPTALDTLTEKMPIVIWGEGGCILPGAFFTEFLSEIAAHNYLVIASNGIDQVCFTTPDMLVDAIDWAISENSRPDSKYYGKIDTEKVAVMGQSCGGLESLHVGSDPRVSTVVAWNSGIFDTGNMGGATKEDLLELHTPTMWVNSGPKDIAYPQAEKDFAEVPDDIPSVWANYDYSKKGGGLFGAHMAGFAVKKGGVFAQAAVLWLDFILKDLYENKDQFVGEDCGLSLADPKWSIQSKNW